MISHSKYIQMKFEQLTNTIAQSTILVFYMRVPNTRILLYLYLLLLLLKKETFNLEASYLFKCINTIKLFNLPNL